MKPISCRFLFALLFIFLGFSIPLTATPLSLKEALSVAHKHASALKSAQAATKAAKALQDSQFSALIPRLTLQGSYTYLGTVPSLVMGGSTLQMGAHDNYSIGPQLSYVLWDNGLLWHGYQSTEALTHAQVAQEVLESKKLTLAVQTAYVQTQLLIEQLSLLNKQTILYINQEKRIKSKYQAGAVSQTDVLLIEHQLLDHQSQLSAVSLELQKSFRRLFDVMEHPFPGTLPELESLADLQHPLEHREFPSFTIDHPSLKILTYTLDSLQSAQKSLQGKQGPILSLAASSTLTYPNGPVLNQFNQNTIGAQLGMPLFFGDPTPGLIDQKKHQIDELKYRYAQTLKELSQNYDLSKRSLSSLSDQLMMAKTDVQKTGTLTKLYLTLYQDGKIPYLDTIQLQNMSLQSQLNLKKLTASWLMQAYSLQFFSDKE